jgi:hypothetical protein|tara:strand:- start:86 stop:268 length:183 start_codon:yes stop_codon:yes gene_type:complete
MIDTNDLLKSAHNGNLTDFQNHFKVAVSSAITNKMKDMKSDLASSVRIDGEEDITDDEGE